MYSALLSLRLVGRPLGFARPLSMIAMSALYTRFPVVLIVLVAALLILRGGNQSKPVWPISWPDLMYSGLYFFYRYGLYSRREQIERFKLWSVLPALRVAAVLGYLVHIGLVIAMEVIREQGIADVKLLELLDHVSYSVMAVFFIAGFIGLFERYLRSPSQVIRWLADFSYWIYIMHLPAVTLLTFFLFRFDWNVELKFLVASAVTAVLGFVTYRTGRGSRPRSQCASKKVGISP